MFKIHQIAKDQSNQRQEDGLEIAKARVQKDLTDFPKDMRNVCVLTFPNPDNLLIMNLKVLPQEGYYHKGAFDFSITVPSGYPFEAPKVKCLQRLFHPNIDIDGNVCLNILREDWSPVQSIGHICIGILHLFLSPNADDPLNKQAAKLLTESTADFQRHVKHALSGETINQVSYSRCY